MQNKKLHHRYPQLRSNILSAITHKEMMTPTAIMAIEITWKIKAIVAL